MRAHVYNQAHSGYSHLLGVCRHQALKIAKGFRDRLGEWRSGGWPPKPLSETCTSKEPTIVLPAHDPGGPTRLANRVIFA